MEIETDYLVVGAGASGMSFTDTLLDQSDADVVLVDRRHRPGGHWNDAYPFVRLHQPASMYGVASRPLEADHMDLDADRLGLARGSEVCEYYLRVLEDHFLTSGRVRFFGMTDYRPGDDGRHELHSLVSGGVTTVRVRRRLVDARYQELSIPSRHTPSFVVDEGVRFLPPNDLVDLAEPASGYTVLGAGKTSMDTCYWLLEQGVDPDRIRWVRPRDSWMMNRSGFPPDDPVTVMEFQARMVASAAEATSGQDFLHRLEDAGTFLRLDADVEPGFFRGANVSEAEVEVLRRVDDVVRKGHVQRIGTDVVELTGGTIESDPDQVYVDCTACGVAPKPDLPIFSEDAIRMNQTTFGIIPWSAALIAFVEANRDDDAEKNRLCPVLSVTGDVDDFARILATTLQVQPLRMAETDLSAWQDDLRLNPTRGLSAHGDDPRLQQAMGTMFGGLEAALTNLASFA